MIFPWSDLAAGTAPPAFSARPAVTVAYASAPPTIYLRVDRHRLRTWSSPDWEKLNRWVDRLDAMDEDAARDALPGGP